MESDATSQHSSLYFSTCWLLRVQRMEEKKFPKLLTPILYCVLTPTNFHHSRGLHERNEFEKFAFRTRRNCRIGGRQHVSSIILRPYDFGLTR